MNNSIPYGRQYIDEEDIRAVVEVLRSARLTTGPLVETFEDAVAASVNAGSAVAFSSGTAALHGAMYALDIGPGDEVIVPAITFAATANAVVYQGGTPVFADIDPDTLLIDPEDVKKKMTAQTRAIIAVDYAGQPCAYDKLTHIAKKRNLPLVADSCHALGASYRGKKLGELAEMAVFSFHPVKHITTGEGGMVVTNNPDRAEKMRLFRNHGIKQEHQSREKENSWFYEMVDLGYNYRLTDFQCALGLSQLKKLDRWINRRRSIAGYYHAAFLSSPAVEPLSEQENVYHVYHLYVVKLLLESLSISRGDLFRALRKKGIGVNVHYIPVYRHPFYRSRFKLKKGLCPQAEKAYERIITLPIFPAMSDDEIKRVAETVSELIDKYAAT